MTSHPLYSSGTAALLIAMTALQRQNGVPPDEALDRAHRTWQEHIRRRGNDSFEWTDLTRIVTALTDNK